MQYFTYWIKDFPKISLFYLASYSFENINKTQLESCMCISTVYLYVYYSWFTNSQFLSIFTAVPYLIPTTNLIKIIFNFYLISCFLINQNTPTPQPHLICNFISPLVQHAIKVKYFVKGIGKFYCECILFHATLIRHFLLVAEFKKPDFETVNAIPIQRDC